MSARASSGKARCAIQSTRKQHSDGGSPTRLGRWQSTELLPRSAIISVAQGLCSATIPPRGKTCLGSGQILPSLEAVAISKNSIRRRRSDKLSSRFSYMLGFIEQSTHTSESSKRSLFFPGSPFWLLRRGGWSRAALYGGGKRARGMGLEQVIPIMLSGTKALNPGIESHHLLRHVFPWGISIEATVNGVALRQQSR